MTKWSHNGEVELVFRALADAHRRALLDALFERDGQSLGQLAATVPEMTRFGVAKHLAVLEEGGLVVTRRAGRSKLHYLNPVPIRLIHDRWISKYAAPWVGALAGLKAELEREDAAADVAVPEPTDPTVPAVAAHPVVA